MSGKAIIAALPVALKKDAEEALWRDYMARCVRMICENTARACGGNALTEEFADILNRKTGDRRGADEIVSDVIKRSGIEVV